MTLLLLAACTRDGVELADLGIEASPVVGTVHRVSFTTSAGARSWVEYAAEDGVWLQTPPGPAAIGHEHLLLGLKAGHTYTWRAVAEGSGAPVRSAGQELEVPPAPDEVPRFTVERLGPVERERFFALMNLVGHDPSYAVIVDQDGDLVWWATPPEPGDNVVMAKPSRDGRHVWVAEFDKGIDTGGGVRKVPLGAMSPDEVGFTPTEEGHHDFVELPDQQTLAFLGHEHLPIEVDGFGEVWLQADTVVEVPIGDDTGPARRVYATSEDYGEAWSMICDHLVPEMYLGRMSTEWGHGNSLVYDEAEDAYFVNFRNLDQIVKVPRSGGAAWRLGGQGNEFAIDDPESWFEHAHLSDLDGEGFAAFSNDLHSGGSRLMAYAMDQAARTVTTLFRYDEPEGRTVPVLGDVDRLPGGGYAVSWGELATIEEIGADGTVRWRATASEELVIGRITVLADLYAP